MKKLLKILGIVLALVVVLVLALPLWIGPVVKGVANAVVPGKTKTEFNLAKFELNPYSGHFALGGLVLGNPDGFTPRNAVTLGEFSVAVDATTLLSDVIVIENITIKDVFVSYVKQDGKYNFDVIGENAAGPEKPAEAKPAEPVKEEPKAEGKGKKVIVDSVSITGVTFQWGPVPIPVPPITISGLGRVQGGLDADAAWEEIYKKVMASLGGVGVPLKDLGVDTEKLAADAAKVANELSQAGLNQADKALDAVKDAKLVEAVQSGSVEETKKAAKAVGDILKSSGDGTSKALKDAGEKFKGLFK